MSSSRGSANLIMLRPAHRSNGTPPHFGSRGRASLCGVAIVIGVTAAAMQALLLTRNARDFAGIPHLDVEA